MTRDGEPITEAPLTKALNTGISYEPLPGPIPLVPQIEERESAIFNGYTWREWSTLAYDERVYAVAHHRLHRLITLHQADAEIKDAETRRRMAEAAAEG